MMNSVNAFLINAVQEFMSLTGMSEDSMWQLMVFVWGVGLVIIWKSADKPYHHKVTFVVYAIVGLLFVAMALHSNS